MLMYIVDASHKEALALGAPVDELAESVHEFPTQSGTEPPQPRIIEVDGWLLCFVANDA